MLHKETVLFTNANGMTFLIGELGIRHKRADEVNTFSDLPPPGEHCIWFLVDCPAARIPIPSTVTYEDPMIFFVVALSPEPLHYKEADKQPVRMWWMSP